MVAVERIVRPGLAFQALTRKTLEDENRRYTGRGGISEETRGLGFLPAYLDNVTGSSHLSCFRDGRRAPVHLLDGLPEQLVLRRDASGRVIALKGSVSAGFVREGRFYTREQAAWAMMREARDENLPSSSTPVQASLSPSRAGGAFLRRARAKTFLLNSLSPSTYTDNKSFMPS